MPALISPELMEETWQSVAQMSVDQLQQLQVLCGKEQEDLTGFVFGFTSDLSPDAAGVALYSHVVLIETFRRTDARFRTIEPGEIERAWNDNLEYIDDLKRAGNRREPFRLPDTYSEPAALQYAMGALAEEDEEDPVDIADDEFWHALRVLKTVIDCMHDAQRAE
jgi:hypothetical protein